MLQDVKSHNFIIRDQNCSKNIIRTKATKIYDLTRTTTNCNISGYLQFEFLDRSSMRQPTLYFIHLLTLTLAARSIGHWLLSATLHLPFAARDNWYDSVSGTNVEYLPWQSLWTRVRGGVVSQVLTIFIGINHVNLTGCMYVAVNTRVVSVLYSQGWNQSSLHRKSPTEKLIVPHLSKTFGLVYIIPSLFCLEPAQFCSALFAIHFNVINDHIFQVYFFQVFRPKFCMYFSFLPHVLRYKSIRSSQ